MTDVIRTPKFRVSFPSVFEKSGPPGTDAKRLKYSVVMLFNPAEIEKDANLYHNQLTQKVLWDAMLNAAKACAVDKWRDKMPPGLVSPFRSGTEKEQYEGYGEGVIFLTAKTERRPGIVDQNVNRIIDPEDFYAGCYAHADINPYAWSYMGKNGIGFGLQNVQKIADGERIGGGASAESSFDAIDEGVEAQGDKTNNATMLFG